MKIFTSFMDFLLRNKRTWFFGHAIYTVYGSLELSFMDRYNPGPDFAFIEGLWREEGRLEFMFRPSEIANLMAVAQLCTSVEGCFVEVGVYRGTSAKSIAEVIRRSEVDKELLLFDTFEGIPKTSKWDNMFWKGQFGSKPLSCNLERTKERLQPYDRVGFHKGLFPDDTGEDLRDKKIAFAHLDLDVFESTLEALETVYPKLSPGAIVLTHDYGQSHGVRKAFDEFFDSKPEKIAKLHLSQAMVRKV